MKFAKLLFGSLLLIVLSGCAVPHPIAIAPNGTGIDRSPSSPPKIKTKIGFFIAPEAVTLAVTTPGGGGDTVRYFPYRDLEAAYERMLTNVFETVVRLAAPAAVAELRKESIFLVITPELITNSSSTGVITWPPTNFTVDLTSKVRDRSGTLVASPRVLGNGQVSGFSELKGDFGLAGRRAMEDALLKMQQSLFEASYGPGATNAANLEFIGQSRPGAPALSADVSDRLRQLKDIFDRSLISREEYEQKKKELLESL